MPKTKKETEPRSFEDAMKRLDEIVGELEDEKLPLDQMIARYEEGVALARSCGEKLDAAEQKVRLIARQSDGSIKLEEFESGEEN
ncbi:MAG: exodeoxyribonuclease VII small subunit [Chthoniobacterales bacterium]|jgi:exodeoxyribonuclease VII small subunit